MKVSYKCIGQTLTLRAIKEDNYLSYLLYSTVGKLQTYQSNLPTQSTYMKNFQNGNEVVDENYLIENIIISKHLFQIIADRAAF